MKPENPVLIILTPGFPKDEEDSTCLPTQQSFVKSIQDLYPDIQIIILSFHYPFSSRPYLWNGISVIPFDGHGKEKMLRLRLWFRIWKQLRSLKKEKNLVGIFSFWATDCALIGKWFGRIHHIKQYCWISGQEAKKENPYIRLMRPKPEDLIAMSDFLQKEFFRNHRIRPMHVIPIGIDPQQFEINNTERDIDILGAGSLIPLKQFSVLIKVVSELTRLRPGIKTMICGKGPEEPALRALIHKLNLQDQISMPGVVQHKELMKLMQRAKIFLHPSSYEGFGAVCIEALYAGAHVISFRRPIAGWIRHWHIVNSEEEMWKKAQEILDDPETKYSRSVPFLMSESAKSVMNLFGL
jgi:glycosyltransferase involved in cell wall biosynthesis